MAENEVRSLQLRLHMSRTSQTDIEGNTQKGLSCERHPTGHSILPTAQGSIQQAQHPEVKAAKGVLRYTNSAQYLTGLYMADSSTTEGSRAFCRTASSPVREKSPAASAKDPIT